ncbi:MAG: hypothetical protein O7H39_01465, partial [Gammaproteobacteria bacterium]|nr:hypothetical protein [Gammaproteobacteria bacterium]
ATRLQLDLDQVHERWQQLKAHPDLDRKIAEVYRREQPREEPADVEEALYGGFLSDADRARCDALHRTLAANGPWPDDLQLRDRRLEVLSARLKARVRSAGLSIEETDQWRAYVSSRLSEEHPRRLTVEAFKAEVEQTMAAEVGPRDAKLLAALKAYGDELAARVLVAGDV